MDAKKRGTSEATEVDGPELEDYADGEGCHCSCCCEERDEPHTWKECATRLAAEVLRMHDVAFDPEHAKWLLEAIGERSTNSDQDTNHADVPGRGAAGRRDAPAVAGVGGAERPSAEPNPPGTHDAIRDAFGARVDWSDRAVGSTSATANPDCKEHGAFLEPGCAECHGVWSADREAEKRRATSDAPTRETCDCGACAICQSMRTGPELVAELARERSSDAPAEYRPSFVVCKCPCGGASHTRRATIEDAARPDYAPTRYAALERVYRACLNDAIVTDCECEQPACAELRAAVRDVWEADLYANLETAQKRSAE